LFPKCANTTTTSSSLLSLLAIFTCSYYDKIPRRQRRVERRISLQHLPMSVDKSMLQTTANDIMTKNYVRRLDELNVDNNRRNYRSTSNISTTIKSNRYLDDDNHRESMHYRSLSTACDGKLMTMCILQHLHSLRRHLLFS
jgi:hypothetical protein